MESYLARSAMMSDLDLFALAKLLKLSRASSILSLIEVGLATNVSVSIFRQQTTQTQNLLHNDIKLAWLVLKLVIDKSLEICFNGKLNG